MLYFLVVILLAVIAAVFMDLRLRVYEREINTNPNRRRLYRALFILPTITAVIGLGIGCYIYALRTIDDSSNIVGLKSATTTTDTVRPTKSPEKRPEPSQP